MTYDELRASFSEEHAPRREHVVPWINLPSAGAIAATAAKRVRYFLVVPGQRFGPSDALYAAACKLQALKALLSTVS